MKKILGLVVSFVLIVLSCFYFFIHQPKNIFDEIYQVTEKTYRSNNILRNIDGFKIRPDWPNDGEYFAYTPSGKYKNLPEGYKDISISFNFGEGIKGMTIRFEKRINSDITLWYSAHYNIKKESTQKGACNF